MSQSRCTQIATETSALVTAICRLTSCCFLCCMLCCPTAMLVFCFVWRADGLQYTREIFHVGELCHRRIRLFHAMRHYKSVHPY